jgi:preprotein translocase subunit SecG
MIIAVTILHVIICLILIAIVLLQTGKGASMGAAFGGASQTLFGGAGPASFLNKITTIAAIVFMLTSFTLAILSSRIPTSSKVLDATPTRQEQPAQPAPPTTSEEQNTPATTGDTSSTENKPVSEAPQGENEPTKMPE